MQLNLLTMNFIQLAEKGEGDDTESFIAQSSYPTLNCTSTTIELAYYV
jgi:hypothetical protein